MFRGTEFKDTTALSFYCILLKTILFCSPNVCKEKEVSRLKEEFMCSNLKFKKL